MISQRLKQETKKCVYPWINIFDHDFPQNTTCMKNDGSIEHFSSFKHETGGDA